MHFKLHLSKRIFFVVLILLTLSRCTKSTSASIKKKFPVPKIDLKPHKYIIYKTDGSLKIDGKLKEDAWRNVDWTSDFVNIKGDSKGNRGRKTHAKLLWNKKYFYVGIQLREKNIWATMTKRDAPLYFDNACEIFIDPDGDTQHYLEFGMNALSTIYDLLLTKPPRDGGHAISEYNIRGLKAAVSIEGEINNPKNKDKKWTVEIAFPIKALKELNLLRGQSPTEAGDQWRVQFARAERQLTISGDKYTLKKDPKTNKPLPPTYTSWAPQGLVNLHYPEMWGFVQFSDEMAGKGADKFNWNRNEKIKWALRKVYYRLKQYDLNYGSYTDDLSKLDIDKINVDRVDFSPSIHATKRTFIASSHGYNKEKVWFINQNGKIWSRKK